ncbi:MAG: cell division protein FtsL [Deltaproteobacteria bacterium]|jgi:cell division protein FtsL|nr:cell division protein FtsL [Deltaproteobacteria bacterium]|tara:strand:- start:6217 stop:6570 length:354 start_codon:yes stop_codon:yes gene_type:complete
MRANRRIETDLSYSRTSRSPKLIEQIGLFDTTTFAFLLLVFFASASGISVIRATHDYRHLFISLQEAREHSNQLGVIWGQLLIEQSTFGVDGRIEQKAVELLEMRVPAVEEIVMAKF